MRRRLRYTLIAILLIPCLLVAGAAMVGPRAARWLVLRKLIPQVERRTGLKLSAKVVHVGPTRLYLGDVQFIDGSTPDTPFLTAVNLTVRYDWADLLQTPPVVADVTLTGAALRIRRDHKGEVMLPERLAERLSRRVAGRSAKADAAEANAATRQRSLRWRRIVVAGATVRVEDQNSGSHAKLLHVDAVIQPDGMATLAINGLRAYWAPQRIALRAKSLVPSGPISLKQPLPMLQVRGGEMQLRSSVRFSGIEGTVRLHQSGPQQRLAVDLAGSFGGSVRRFWTASGQVYPRSKSGAFDVEIRRFGLGAIAPYLERTPLIDTRRTVVEGRLSIEANQGRIAVLGDLAFERLNLFHPKLARRPLRDQAVTLHVEAQANVDEDWLSLERLNIGYQGLSANFSARIDRVRSTEPVVQAQLLVPTINCQHVLEALPTQLVPRLRGFQLEGEMAADIQLNVDYAQLDQLKMGGSLGIEACRVVQAPPEASVERLMGPFEHRVEPIPDQYLSFWVGPQNPDYVSFADLSPHVINALMTTEDARFFSHRGFAVSQFGVALARNLKQGSFRLGASTITMQMVKNVLLSHEKTLSRKLQELFLTWYLEQGLPKDRIMEIYLNAIEFGPAIYGIGAACRHYFDKAPQQITAREAAFLATLLPSPRTRYREYCRGSLSPRWKRYVRRIVDRMYAKGRLLDEEYREATQQVIVFNRDLFALSEADCVAQIDLISEAWQAAYEARLRQAVMEAAPQRMSYYLAPLLTDDGTVDIEAASLAAE